MTNEEKQLLLKDLCARLPYVTYYDLSYYGHKTRAVLQEFIATKESLKSLVKVNTIVEPIPYENIKPYLRPLSSMTEEEKTLMAAICLKNAIGNVEVAVSELSDFYNSRHFDYRGLIPMGLALEAPKDMYKTE